MPSGESEQRMEFMLMLRRRGIADHAVLRAMDEIPREHFVDPRHLEQAYADQAMPIACGQTISQPYLVAYMSEALRVRPTHRVLEIGTGSGYQTAILSKLAREVISIERYRTLAESARTRLATLGCNNAEVLFGDGLEGQGGAKFDRIMVTAAAETEPTHLVGQLADDGVMLAPLGAHSGAQELIRFTRTANGIERETLLTVRFVPLLPGRAREL